LGISDITVKIKDFGSHEKLFCGFSVFSLPLPFSLDKWTFSLPQTKSAQVDPGHGPPHLKPFNNSSPTQPGSHVVLRTDNWSETKEGIWEIGKGEFCSKLTTAETIAPLPVMMLSNPNLIIPTSLPSSHHSERFFAMHVRRSFGGMKRFIFLLSLMYLLWWYRTSE
jgi:hypothetical protein